MTHLTPERRQKFLDRLAAGHTAKAAAKAAGLTRQRFYQLRAEDEGFAADWAAAEQEGVDALEEEALRRAVQGVRSVHPIYFMGQKVGERIVRTYSDGLLTMLMKARDRGRFGDKATVDVNDQSTPSLSDDKRAERIAALIASVKERAEPAPPQDGAPA